jgi:hypothetical protein
VTFTVDIGGPFKILGRPYLLKATDRKPPLSGEQVVPVAAVAKVGEGEIPVAAIADGRGLGQKDADLLLEHDVDPNHMGVTPEGSKVEYVEFDFGKEVALDLVQVWNYNEPDKTQWGLRRADVAAWTASSGWKKVKSGVQFSQAEGTADYDEPTQVRLEGVHAAKVRLENLAGFEGSNRIGLSEVRFFQARSAKAVKPVPANGGRLSNVASASLCWTPGEGAGEQRVYVGQDASNMKLLATLKPDAADVQLSALGNEGRFVWRIDSVRPDGSAIAGDQWSFWTSSLVGWWKLDETEGTVAKDSSGNHLDGRLMGNPQWEPTGGKLAGALRLDGVDDYVALPEAAGAVSGDLTISIWACPTADKKWGRLVDLGNGQESDNIVFARGYNSKNVVFEIWSGSSSQGQNWSTKDELELNRWHLYTATSDNEGNVTVYRDGDVILKAKGEGARDLARTANYIGKSNWSADEYYQGLVDDLRIYDVCLSAEQVKALYEGRPPASQAQASMLPHLRAQ